MTLPTLAEDGLSLQVLTWELPSRYVQKWRCPACHTFRLFGSVGPGLRTRRSGRLPLGALRGSSLAHVRPGRARGRAEHRHGSTGPANRCRGGGLSPAARVHRGDRSFGHLSLRADAAGCNFAWRRRPGSGFRRWNLRGWLSTPQPKARKRQRVWKARCRSKGTLPSRRPSRRPNASRPPSSRTRSPPLRLSCPNSPSSSPACRRDSRSSKGGWLLRRLANPSASAAFCPAEGARPAFKEASLSCGSTASCQARASDQHCRCSVALDGPDSPEPVPADPGFVFARQPPGWSTRWAGRPGLLRQRCPETFKCRCFRPPSRGFTPQLLCPQAWKRCLETSRCVALHVGPGSRGQLPDGWRCSRGKGAPGPPYGGFGAESSQARPRRALPKQVKGASCKVRPAAPKPAASASACCTAWV